MGELPFHHKWRLAIMEHNEVRAAIAFVLVGAISTLVFMLAFRFVTMAF
jgi:hypothetical protein